MNQENTFCNYGGYETIIDYFGLLIQYAENDMSNNKRNHFAKHLANCNRCQEEIKEMQSILNELESETAKFLDQQSNQ